MKKEGLNKDKKRCTSVITDIRNFSGTFKDFQNKNSPEFLKFIENYYESQNMLAKIIDDKVHMSSTGDGLLAIFLDEDEHHKMGYAYILSAHRVLKNMCAKFIKENPDASISFGIGGDSGNVWSVGKRFLQTYVGTVVNRASRIEATTKMFANTTTAIGNSLYKSLVKDFYPTAHSLMEETPDYDSLLNTNPEAILISKQLMLQYIFDMQLKGIQANAPIFRLSEVLVNDDNLYWKVMTKLVDEEKLYKIKRIVK